jgi:hypothetical protein
VLGKGKGDLRSVMRGTVSWWFICYACGRGNGNGNGSLVLRLHSHGATIYKPHRYIRIRHRGTEAIP